MSFFLVGFDSTFGSFSVRLTESLLCLTYPPILCHNPPLTVSSNKRVTAVAIPYSSAAENVAYNQGYSDPATQAVQGWIKSTGHRQNMEGNFNLTGIGVATNAKGQYYFTQMFIRSR